MSIEARAASEADLSALVPMNNAAVPAVTPTDETQLKWFLEHQ